MVYNNLNNYPKVLTEHIITAQEQERFRIASELHDSLIGKLIVLRLTHQINYNYEKIDSLINESIEEVRRISHNLTPPLLEFVSITELLENIINQWKNHLNISLYYNITYHHTYTNPLKIHLARIVQELITNIHKHANTKTASLHLKITRNHFAFVMADKGNGFNIKSSEKGIGLQNISLHVQSLDGRYKIKSNTKGTIFIFYLNVNAHEKYFNSNSR